MQHLELNLHILLFKYDIDLVDRLRMNAFKSEGSGDDGTQHPPERLGKKDCVVNKYSASNDRPYSRVDRFIIT